MLQYQSIKKYNWSDQRITGSSLLVEIKEKVKTVIKYLVNNPYNKNRNIYFSLQNASLGWKNKNVKKYT